MSEAQPVFNIERIYLKDLSVEVPHAPDIFSETVAPEISVNIQHRATPLRENYFEVALTVTISAMTDKPVFLIEVTQAGLFLVKNVPQEHLGPILAIGCPNTLFPFLRETISSATVRAGFAPMMLSPISFEALYMQRMQQLQQEASKQAQPETQVV